MYNGNRDATMKAKIEADLRDPNGHLRVVVVSSAMGRGSNFPGIHHIIFLVAPKTLEDFRQAVGRTGRNSNSIARVDAYWLGVDIPKNKAHEAMIRFLRNPDRLCRHVIMMRYFAFPSDEIEKEEKKHQSDRDVMKLHDCCDICVRDCQCGCQTVLEPVHQQAPRALDGSTIQLALREYATELEADATISFLPLDVVDAIADFAPHAPNATALQFMFDLPEDLCESIWKIIMVHRCDASDPSPVSEFKASECPEVYQDGSDPESSDSN